MSGGAKTRSHTTKRTIYGAIQAVTAKIAAAVLKPADEQLRCKSGLTAIPCSASIDRLQEGATEQFRPRCHRGKKQDRREGA